MSTFSIHEVYVRGVYLILLHLHPPNPYMIFKPKANLSTFGVRVLILSVCQYILIHGKTVARNLPQNEYIYLSLIYPVSLPILDSLFYHQYKC